jgi:hypothetical protein
VTDKEVAFLRASQAPKTPTRPTRQAEGDRTRSGRKRKSRKGRGLLKFVIGWIFFLVGLVMLGLYLNRPRTEAGGSEADIAETAESGRERAEAYQACVQLVTSFLQQTTPEQRAKFVVDPVETLRKMSRTGGLALRLGESESYQLERFSPLKIGETTAYESEVSFSDGRRAEFVFLPDGEDAEGKTLWRIDWAQLVRYSDHPWQLFLAGSTGETGEFRLLARRRAVAAGQRGDATSLILFAPDPWNPERLGVRSPSVELRPNSREVRMLERHFERRDEGQGCFGSQLTAEDPVAMVRIRVRLRRSAPEEKGDDPQLEIEELLACHWISVDDPGVKVAEGLEDLEDLQDLEGLEEIEPLEGLDE